MAPKERAAPGSRTAAPGFMLNDFADAGQKQLEAIIDMQKVIIGAFEKMSRDWFARNGGIAAATSTLAQAAPSAQKSLTGVELQNEVLHSFEAFNREWAARIKTEMDLATECADALAAARSLPDAAAACQAWMGKRMELILEDGRRLAAENQKVITATSRYFADGWGGGTT